MVPGFAYREADDRIVCRFQPALELDATEDHEYNVSANTQLFNEVIGAHIRERPEQWLWLHDRWRKPDGGTTGHGDKGTGGQRQ